MNFSVPTNLHADLPSYLSSLNTGGRIYEVYGKLPIDDLGGGRSSFPLSQISKTGFEAHVRELQRAGFRFNYLLNALCADTEEFKKIRTLLDWISGMGIDRVTVANPVLFTKIKESYPHFQVCVSAIANVNSPRRARYWESLGADSITLPGYNACRSRSFLSSIRQSVRCRLQMIVNDACQFQCPLYLYHYCRESHASQSRHAYRGYSLDYCFIICRFNRLRDKINFIRSNWIRPEDTRYYESLGVDSFKIVDRRLSTGILANIITAYVRDGRYDGNLLDLLPVFHGRTFNAHKDWKRRLFLLRNFFHSNFFETVGFLKLFDAVNMHVDNASLDGFLENMPADCDGNSCDSCSYCRDTAEKSVKVDEKYRVRVLNTVDRLLQNTWGLRYESSGL
ncbi:MAG: U32 family peptidase [Candidatus Omnitrophica bacterium]|nr:U32 family peptidase [Candidatus Omnitrophota bacterium]